MLASLLEQGYVRVPGVFSPDEAAAMRDEVWRELARQYGISEVDRATWRVEAPSHLQGLKRSPAFSAIGGATLRDTLTSVLGSFVALDWYCAYHHKLKTSGWTVGPPDPKTGKRKLRPPPARAA